MCDKLQSRVLAVIRSQECLQIRFRLGNVGIQRYMYPYLAGAILNGNVHVCTGDGSGYEDKDSGTTTPNTITLDSDNPDRCKIVHEATHAIIDGTHVGKAITTGHHEAAAFLAEALFCLYSGDDDNVNYSVPHLAPPLFDLARQVQAFNARNPNGLYHCPPGDVGGIIALMAAAPFESRDMYASKTMSGWGDGPCPNCTATQSPCGG